MNPIVWLVLIIAIIFFVEAGQIGAAAITALILLADLFGNVLAKTFTILGNAAKALGETAKADAADVEKARPNPPSGRKFFEEWFSLAGRSLGKADRATKEGKRVPHNFNIGALSDSVGRLMDETAKLFKR